MVSYGPSSITINLVFHICIYFFFFHIINYFLLLSWLTVQLNNKFTKSSRCYTLSFLDYFKILWKIYFPVKIVFTLVVLKISRIRFITIFFSQWFQPQSKLFSFSLKFKILQIKFFMRNSCAGKNFKKFELLNFYIQNVILW